MWYSTVSNPVFGINSSFANLRVNILFNQRACVESMQCCFSDNAVSDFTSVFRLKTLVSEMSIFKACFLAGARRFAAPFAKLLRRCSKKSTATARTECVPPPKTSAQAETSAALVNRYVHRSVNMHCINLSIYSTIFFSVPN